ncbi:hypothetical protein D3C84_334500 [compost metagenome]
MGAGGDPHRPRLGAPLAAQFGSALQQGRIDAQVELDRAGHAHVFGASPEGAEAFRLSLGLHGDPAQFRQHRRGELAKARIAAGRALGQARIGQNHRNAAHGALMDMVGPEFGLHDHRQPGPCTVEEARRRPGQVIGQVAMLHPLAEQRADALGTGGCHAGDGDGQVRMALQQGADHGRGGDALAHRHRMDPDAAGRERRQAEGKTFADTPGIGRRAPGTPGQAQGHQRQAEVEQQGIEGSIHGRGA